MLVTDHCSQDSAVYIQDEHLTASQGAYMEFVGDAHAAEDEEHTEVCDGQVNFGRTKLMRVSSDRRIAN